MNLATSTSVKALSIAAFFAFAPAAYAFDASGNALADTFLADLEAGGLSDISVGSVTGGDDNAEISNLTGTINKDGKTGKVSIDRVSFNGGEVVDGKLSAQMMEMEGLTIDDDDATVTMQNMSATDVVFPTTEAFKTKSPSLGSDAKYKTADVNNLVIGGKANGQQVPVEHIAIKLDDFVGDIPRSFVTTIDNIVVSKAMLDPKGQATFDQLGYDKITISVAIEGTWDDAAGVGDIKSFKLSGKDVGTLTLTARIGGLTPEVVAKLKELQGNQNPEQAMQLLQGLTVEGLSIRFDNDSIVERGLDLQAKQMGTTRDALAQQLSGALPLMLSALQNPAFQEKVAKAGATFLTERKSIMASANPAQPVPVAQLVGTVMVAPQSIPDVLGVDITTNP